ncbi:MAG: exodeoxyribonuclease VII large subunit, partial [Acutalibacteraceae bacterium]|nr:exodeoxyribonuclease VII large subunit [Acutalibacteraceae bacterium]
MPSVLTVRQLNTYVRSLLEGDSRLAFLSVSGEISNFKNHYGSGHLYFSLKDKDALIKCVMFRGSAVGLDFVPEDGMQVVCTGRVSLYEKDGQYQFYIDSMVKSGQGDLLEQFKLIKEKLEKEGLFAPETKRALPKFPQRIAVITSKTGAALQDITNIISRRYPICEIILCGVLVQGADAAPSMIKALDNVYKNADADLIIIGRGGGSAEDLWAFNDEALARKIYESPIPVI